MRKTYVILAVGFITLVMSGANRNGAAADYPTRTIEIICPNAAGGGMDFVMTLFKLDMACSATTAFVGPGRLRLLVVASDHRFGRISRCTCLEGTGVSDIWSSVL